MSQPDKHSICEEHQFEKVYREHVQTIFNFLYYRSGDRELSEDLVQEAFVKLWIHCAKVKRERARAFLFKVARNLFLNKMERKKVVLKFEQQLRSGIEVENPEFLLEKKEFHRRLTDAINQLTEAQREVFLLNRIDRLTYREIAELLGISQKAVEKRMHKALLELRKLNEKI